MSNNSSDKSPNVPVGQPSISSAANASLSNRGEPQAKPSVPVNLNNAATLNRPRELFDERSEPPKASASVVNADHDGPRELAAAGNIPSVHEQTAGKTESEDGRQVNVPVPSASATVRPSAVARNPSDPAGEVVAISQSVGPAEVAAQAGGAIPPGLPPTPVVANCPEEPKLTPRPTTSDAVPPPLLDVEEFIREAEDRKRGAKTMREMKAVAEYIRVIRQRGIPVASIHAGLRKKGLVTCSRSRFDEICAELLPELFEPKRRGNA